MALTQEQIQQLMAGYQGATPEQLSQMGGMYRDPATGQGIQANYAGRYDPATGDYVAGPATEYMVSAPGATRAASSPFDRYSTEGQYTGTGNYAPAANINKDFLKYMAALAGTAAAGGMFGGGGIGGGAGGAPTASPAATGGFNAAVDSQLANAALGGEALAGYTGAGAVTPSLGGAGAASGGGLLSGLTNALPSGITSLVGPAATIAGGLLGSKPQQQSQTATRYIDPRFDSAIFEQGGLLGKVQNSLANRPAPGIGAQLMNITPRRNPFSRG